MLKLLKELLGNPARDRRPPSEALATALLLLELAKSDFEIAAEEETRMRDLLAQRFGLGAEALETLMDEARRNAAQSVSLHEYVQVLNGSLDAGGKRKLMAMLWQVAYADGRIDKYEEHLLRRLADLLYLPMADYIQVKLEADGRPDQQLS